MDPRIRGSGSTPKCHKSGTLDLRYRYLWSSIFQCGGSGMFIPDPTFFHPGSRIRTVSIPDPGSSSKNLSILTPKKAKKSFLSSKKNDPGCSSRIPDPKADFLPSRILDPGVKKAPNPGSRIRNTAIFFTKWFTIYLRTYFFHWLQNGQVGSRSVSNLPPESGYVIQDKGSTNPYPKDNVPASKL